MEDYAKLIQDATLRVDQIDELPRDILLDTLNKYTFAIIRGLVDPANIHRSVKLMKKNFLPENDRATTGESSEEVKDNFQKLSIGCAKHGNVDRPRFKRVFYNPFNATDHFEMHKNFRQVARVRNLLADLPLDFAIDTEENGMWTAARIHHFPTGGGFMVGHKDTVLPGIYEQKGLPSYFQPLMLMTKKGQDFHTGGGFIQLRGTNICYEDYTEPGDIAIYDSSTVHGVADIDTHLPFIQNSLNGRMAALVTMYKSL